MTPSRRRALEQFGAFADSLPDAVVVVDESGRIAHVNKQTELLFGRTRDELLDRAIEILFPPAFPTTSHQLRAGDSVHAAIQPTQRHQTLGLRKDGSTFPMELAVGEMSGAALFLRFSCCRIARIFGPNCGPPLRGKLESKNKINYFNGMVRFPPPLPYRANH